MKLKEYIDRFPEYDLDHFVRNFDVARATLWKALKGRKMDLEVAVKIQKSTAGIVTCEDLVGSCEENQHENDKTEKQQQQSNACGNTPVSLDNAN